MELRRGFSEGLCCYDPAALRPNPSQYPKGTTDTLKPAPSRFEVSPNSKLSRIECLNQNAQHRLTSPRIRSLSAGSELHLQAKGFRVAKNDKGWSLLLQQTQSV